MEQESFYLTLPSNVLSSPTNSLSSYYTILPNRITLNGDWKVGLSEISYTKSWYNIPENEDIYIYDKRFTQLKPKNFKKLELVKGNYESEEILLNEINKIAKEYKVKTPPKLKFDSITKKVIAVEGTDNQNESIFLYLSLSIREMLGFPKKRSLEYKYITNENNEMLTFELYQPKKIERGERPVDLCRGIRSIYVYSDIVHPVRVGDAQVQLLRNVEVLEEKKFGSQCVLKYSKPYYHPVITDDFNSIRIYIKDDSGRNIPFEFGRVTVTLHFKKWINTM